MLFLPLNDVRQLVKYNSDFLIQQSSTLGNFKSGSTAGTLKTKNFKELVPHKKLVLYI